MPPIHGILPISLYFPSPISQSYLLLDPVLFAAERHHCDLAPLLPQRLCLISLFAIPLFYPLPLCQLLDHVSFPLGFSFRISCPSLAIHPCIDASRINFAIEYHLLFLKLHTYSAPTSTDRFRIFYLCSFHLTASACAINERSQGALFNSASRSFARPTYTAQSTIFRHHRRQTHIYNSLNFIRNVILLYTNISIVLTP